MTREEIRECIELNNSVIKLCKDSKRKLEAVVKTLSEYGETWDTDRMNGAAEAVMKEIRDLERTVEERNKWNAKRKKQLKLLDQLEALEGDAA